MKERFLDFRRLGYVHYFRIRKTFGCGFTIGPSTWERTKRSRVWYGKGHWDSVNGIKAIKLPFGLSLITIDFGKTGWLFAVDLVW